MHKTTALAKNVSHLLDKRQVKINDLIYSTNLSRGFIDKILTGKTQSPRVLELKKLANYFHVTIDQLLDEAHLPTHKEARSIPMISLQDLNEDILWEIADKEASRAFLQVPDFLIPADFIVARGNLIFPTPFENAYCLFIDFKPLRKLSQEYALLINKKSPEKYHICKVYQENNQIIIRTPHTNNFVKYIEPEWEYLGKVVYHTEPATLK